MEGQSLLYNVLTGDQRMDCLNGGTVTALQCVDW